MLNDPSLTEYNVLLTHEPYFGLESPLILEQIQVNNIIKFFYEEEERVVFVLNPNWQTKLHGLSLKYIDREQFLREVVSKIMTNETVESFYKRVVKQKQLLKTDSYRIYFRSKMINIRRLPYNIGNDKFL